MAGLGQPSKRPAHEGSIWAGFCIDRPAMRLLFSKGPDQMFEQATMVRNKCATKGVVGCDGSMPAVLDKFLAAMVTKSRELTTQSQADKAANDAAK